MNSIALEHGLTGGVTEEAVSAMLFATEVSDMRGSLASTRLVTERFVFARAMSNQRLPMLSVNGGSIGLSA